jgi:hypothetical protein
LVEKSEDKECKVCRDGLHVWYGRNVWPQALLELGKDIPINARLALQRVLSPAV